jgi:hypothetical protein
MVISWKSIILLFTLVFTAACSPPLSEAEMTATQEALVSSTPTLTNTPTVTRTLPPTLTPTITITPIPTIPPVVVEAQNDGTTLVRFNIEGFEFVLPQGWNFTATDATRAPGGARFDLDDGTFINLTVFYLDTDRWWPPVQTAEQVRDFYCNRLNDESGVDVHRCSLTTNRHNVQLGYLEASGDRDLGGDVTYENYHEYSLFFQSNHWTIRFWFHGNINAGRDAIELIQDSIQFPD